MPGRNLNAEEADRADEFLERLDHFRLAGNFSIRKRTHADDSKMLRIPKWRPVFLLTLRRKDQMERASTIMFCDVVRGIGFKVIRAFSASATNYGCFSVFRRAAAVACTQSHSTPGRIS